MKRVASFLRQHALMLLALLLIVPCHVAWGWSDLLGNLGGDSAYYMMMASAYSPFLPHDELFARVAATSRFPPLYPLVLAYSGAAPGLPATHLATTVMLFAALIALYAWLLSIGVRNALASGLALLTAFLPQTLQLALWPQSESLYLLLSLLCLLALNHYRHAPAWPSALIAAAGAALALLTRSVGLTLIPAVAATLVLGARKKHSAALLLAVAPAILWAALHAAPGGYVGIVGGFYANDPLTRLWHQLLDQPQLFRFGFAGNFLQTIGLIHVVDVLAIATIAAWLRRLRRLEADAIYCLCYAGLLAIWPYPEEIARLLWPVVPILIGALVAEMTRLGGKVSAFAGHAAGAGVFAAMVLLCAPVFAFYLDRWSLAQGTDAELRHIPEWYGLERSQAAVSARTHLELERELMRLPNLVPADQCIVSVRPQLVQYLAHRESVLMPRAWTDDADLERQLRATGCDYLVMVAWTDRVYPTSMWPHPHLMDRIDVIDAAVMQYEKQSHEYAVGLLGRLKPETNEP